MDAEKIAAALHEYWSALPMYELRAAANVVVKHVAIPALVEAEADRDRARDAAVALEQQLAEIKKITDQIESAAASDVRIRDERIEAAIERDGVWGSSRNPDIAHLSTAIDIQTGIVKRLRRALDGGER